MILISVGKKLVRTRNFRIDAERPVKKDSSESQEARVLKLQQYYEQQETRLARSER
jgi:hypothetical protein